jgi:RHS repeat-associated protein
MARAFSNGDPCLECVVVMLLHALAPVLTVFIGAEIIRNRPPGSNAIPHAVKDSIGMVDYAVAVTPDTESTPNRRSHTGNYTATFTVSNTGTQSDGYTFRCTSSLNVTCLSVSHETWNLAPNGVVTVDVMYAVHDAGLGSLTLTAYGTARDAGLYNVPVGSYGVEVTPKGDAAGGVLANTGGHQQTFTVRNLGTQTDTYTLACSVVGNLTCLDLSATTVTLNSGATASVSAYFTAGMTGNGTVRLTANGNQVSDVGSWNLTIMAGGGEPTTITTPWSTEVTSPQLTVNIVWCDADDFLVGGQIWLNGVDVTSSFSAVAGSAPPGCVDFLRRRATLTLALGANTLETEICDESANCDFIGDNSYIYNPNRVEVTPDNKLVSLLGGSTASETFTVKNVGSVPATYALTATCSGSATACSPSVTSIPLAPSASGSVTVTYRAGGAGTSGTVQLRATYAPDPDAIADDVGSLSVSSPFTVAVDPESEAVGFGAGASNTQTFTVTNTASSAQTYNLIATCTGAVTGCSAPSSVTLGSQQRTDVAVTFSTGATNEAGTVTLRAQHSSDALNADVGSVSVTIGVTAENTLDLVGATQLADRDLCVVAYAGGDAAYECGDLRIVHSLPAVRTFGRAWAPTLIYNSQHANPYPIVASNITLPSGVPLPDSVVAILTVAGTVRDTGSWLGSQWTPGTARRIAVGFDATSLATGRYSYTLDVKKHTPSGVSSIQTDVGDIVIVNRSASEFGAGWWLAGLERLYFLAGGANLWVGGDGSTRIYQPAGANVWRAPNVDRPDSMTWDGTHYVRHLPAGVKVKFLSNGRHVVTVDRLNRQTTFTYDEPTGRLLTIAVPLGPSPTYTFAYAAGVLDYVLAPGPGGTQRTVQVTISGGRMTTLQDPDQSSVSFSYDVPSFGNRITARTNRRGHIVRYGYAAGFTLRDATIEMGVGLDPIVYGFRALESKGLSGVGASGAVAAPSANTELLGPRTDVVDDTKIWLNRFGQPRRIRNALGHEVVVTADATWPALAARVRYPNGRIVGATYNSRALPLEVTDSSVFRDTLATRLYATTRYEWDPQWPFVTKITLAEGEFTQFQYDPSTGNRLWQQNGSDPASRTTYGYGSCGLVATITTPLSPVERVFHDALCNRRRQDSPKGFLSLFFKDNLGRDTLVISPIDTVPARDSAQLVANGARQRRLYDASDGVIQTFTFAPARTYTLSTGGVARPVAAETSVVVNHYDAEGNPLAVERWSEPDTALVGVLIDGWEYDPAARVTAMLHGDGSKDRFELDAAGNQIKTITRRIHVITARYDVLNRPTSQIVPPVSYSERQWCSARYWSCPINPVYNFPFYGDGLTIPKDSLTFRYDIAGNVVAAENLSARVWRSYSLAGTLLTDSTEILPYSSAGPTGYHRYGLRFGYDLEARRRWLEHPAAFASPTNRVLYTYHPVTGALESVRDVRGNTFRYNYDLEGRLARLDSPGGVSDTSIFDGDGNAIRRLVRTPFTTLFDDQLSFDARGKVLRAIDGAGTSFSAYSGLGTLVLGEWFANWGAQRTIEEYRADALGNTFWRRENGDLSSYAEFSYRYAPETGQLTRIRGLPKPIEDDPIGDKDTTLTEFDMAGNVRFSEFHAKGTMVGQEWTEGHEAVTASFYGADHKLRVLQTQTNSKTDITRAGVFEEYRYDALGRRVLLRARRDSTCTHPHCLSVIERFVWDGDQLLYEVRMPGGDAVSYAGLETGSGTSMPEHFGTVGYTHGLGIDRPLNVFKVGGTIVAPHANWRGVYQVGTYVDGHDDLACAQTSTCVVDWPAPHQRSLFYHNRPNEPFSWFGSLITNKRDGSGQLYMRNRYYDPATGRFTQEDPIGLAGGLNLYGFAGGDPVNLGDAFGLCPDSLKTNKDACIKADGGGGQAHDKCEVAGILRNYQRALLLHFRQFAGARANYPADFDFKIWHSGDHYEFDGKWLKADEFGNAAAGYAGQSVFGALGYQAMRWGGRQFASQKNSGEDPSDRESVPMINMGADRAFLDAGGVNTGEGFAPVPGLSDPQAGPLTRPAGCSGR